VRRSVGRRIDFPTRAIVYGQIWTSLPFILKKEVVLIQIVLFGIQRNFVPRLERQENIVAQV
jgi:hypothetical protein